MAFDPVISNAGRLHILTALVQGETETREFVELRRVTNLTDGNLSAHAKRLASAGYVAVQKEFRAGKPVTSFKITPAGREALEAHARELLAAVGVPRRIALPEPVSTQSDDWID
jgi:DNA-binding MarR family transcriptional regulator